MRVRSRCLLNLWWKDQSQVLQHHRLTKHCQPMTRCHHRVKVEVVPRPRLRLRATACCPVLKCWQRPRLTVSDSPCGVAAAPNDAVTETSWAGCDVGGAGGCIAPCEGACEDREGVLVAVGRRDCPDCWHRLTLSLDTRSRNLEGSSSSPFGVGYRTRPVQPPFPAGGCRRGW